MKPSLSRKQFVSLLSGMPLALTQAVAATTKKNGAVFPAKDEFEIKGTYLNAAFTHPMSKGSVAEIRKFLDDRMVNGKNPASYDAYDRTEALQQFARLIKVSPAAIAWVPSTMYGENLIVNGLELVKRKAHVVTDALHFHGSLHLYNQLQLQGVKVTVVKPVNNEIRLSDLDKAITPGTVLVALSGVSATTGFQHNLKAVADLAHSKGALVYADLIQQLGTMPLDITDSGIDACAAATYKWLMGDFGVGFLYVKPGVLPRIKRTVTGYRQMASSESHILPFEKPAKSPFTSTAKTDMSGHFEVGTFANGAISALRYSLKYLNTVGLDKIQQYRQPLVDRLREGINSNRFIPLTPEGTQGAILSFAFENARQLEPALAAAGISISVYDHMIRISPSFYNDTADVDALVSVLKKFR